MMSFKLYDLYSSGVTDPLTLFSGHVSLKEHRVSKIFRAGTLAASQDQHALRDVRSQGALRAFAGTGCNGWLVASSSRGL